MQWSDIEKLSFHISRHTFGTLLAELGVPIYLLQEYMNHSDIKTTQKYIHNSRMNQNKMLANIVFPE
jgi:integrase